jgi:hypothetical protein
MKTQTISVFAKYLVDKGFRVLICTPSSKSLDELKLRYASLNNESTYDFMFSKEINFINLLGFPRRTIFTKKRSELEDYFGNVDVVICDEAEYDTASGAVEIFHMMKNIKMIYGFSGTADKVAAEPVSVINGIEGNVKSNSKLAGLIGFTLVFRKPEDYKITLRKIKTSAFDNGWREIVQRKWVGDDNAPVLFSEQMTLLHKTHELGRMIQSVVRKRGLTFIPMTALKVIDFYNDNYFFNDGESSVIISSCRYSYV